MARAGWTAVASAIASAALIGVLASPAGAFHIPGASYSGNVSGGGTISFTVSGDGSAVTNLTLNGPIEGPGCSLSSKQYSQPASITNHLFNINDGEMSGGFPNPRGAYGHFSIPVFGIPTSCTVAGSWSASTSASPNGSEECQAAQAEVKMWKRKLARAKKKGNEAKIKKVRRKWAAARSVRDTYCI